MDSNCCSEPVSCAAVEEDGTSGLVKDVFLLTRIRLALMLYFFMVAQYFFLVAQKALDTLQNSTGNSGIDKVQTSLE